MSGAGAFLSRRCDAAPSPCNPAPHHPLCSVFMAWNQPPLHCGNFLRRIVIAAALLGSALAALLTSNGLAGERELWEAQPISLSPRAETRAAKPIDDRWIFEMESGFLWKIGTNTPIDYELAPQIISARGPRHFGGTAFGGKWCVRPQHSLLMEAVVAGPETYYLGYSASPVAEWWNAEESLCLFLSAGGGFGFVDSQDNVVGAQGQDFTFNWFAKSGIRMRIKNDWYFSAAAFFQHMSNRGMTDPNPGLDALGGLIGFSRPF